MVDQLRDMAAELRKVAAELLGGADRSSPHEKVELDSEKVRDFLVFFGANK